MTVKKAKLVVLRHGQTPYNAAHLMTGQHDAPLTALGEEQGREAGKLLAGMTFDKVYSSTLSRAFNTASLALEGMGTHEHLRKADGSYDITQHKGIVEMDAGDFTHRCHKTDPEIVNWVRGWDLPMPNGESDKMTAERVKAFFDSEVLPRLERGENVLVVCHAGIVRSFDFVTGVEQPPADGVVAKKSIPNAAPTVYEYENGKLVGQYFIENPKKPDAAQAVDITPNACVDNASLQKVPPVNENKLPPKPKFG
jgi:2,3-bisphosphoglycerate-dependent phosphoglycerate mutase